MVESIDYSKSFQLAKRFELYRVQKSWGIMVILMGISISFLRIQGYFIDFLVDPFQLDFSSLFWNILVPITFIIYNGLLIVPFLLAFFTYRSVKKLVVEDKKISTKQYSLFGFTLLSFYLFPIWIKLVLEPVIYFLIFPNSFAIEDGMITIYTDTSLQEDASILIFVAIAFLSSFFLLRKIIKFRKLSELLYPGLVIIGLSFIIILFYHFVFLPAQKPPTYDALIDLISWITTFILGGGYLTSGYYSIRQAYLTLEGK